MPSTYQPMGSMPAGYGSILNDARQNLVRMPDGSYAPFPQMGGPTSLDQMYGGILPSSPPSPSSL